MNRRTFVAVGASAVAVGAATNATAQTLQLRPARFGQRATLSGWIRPAAHGPGHYFVLGPRAGVRDPGAKHISEWPEELTLVYPADADAIRPGPVTLVGQFYRGKYKDDLTGHMAGAVLTDARPV
jgi:hypothetical protein